MEYLIEVNSNNEIVSEKEIDEFGNVNIEYFNEELDKEINGYQLFKNVKASYNIELNINKQLYENGNISKELYEKVENILLERLRIFNNIIK